MPWTCCSGRSSSPASLRINGTPIPPSYIQAFPLEAENWKSATSGPPQSKGRRYSIRTEKQKSLTRVDTRKALVDKANCQGQSLSCRLDWGLALLTSGKRDERNRSHTKNECRSCRLGNGGNEQIADGENTTRQAHFVNGYRIITVRVYTRSTDYEICRRIT